MPPAAKKAKVDAEADADAPVVVCFGDSNTHGFGSESLERLP